MLAITHKPLLKNPGNIACSAIGLLLSVLAYLQLNASINHDVSWYINIARGLLDGKKLYVDFVEVNPPLGMWIMVPVVAFADYVNFRADLVYKSILMLVSAASLIAVSRYMALDAYWNKSKRLIFIFLFAFGLLFFPGSDFGQREHLLVLLFAPWVFLRLAKHAGATVGVVEACVVGVFASVAVLLKPHSVFAPLFVEVLLLWQFRSLKATFSVENIAAGIVVLIYAAIIVVFTPEYLSEMIPMGQAAYYPFYGFAFYAQILKARWSIMALMVAVLVLKFTRLENNFQTKVLFCAAFGFFVSYLVQNKGYAYQILPASIFAWSALAALFAALWRESRKYRMLLSFIAIFGGLHVVAEELVYTAGDAPFVAGIQRFAPDARSISIASTRVGHGFPLVENLRLKWTSRFPTQWLAPYVASKWKSGPVPQDALVRNTLANTVSDLISGQPDIVFVEEATDQFYVPGGRFDYVAFWSNDERFPPFWQNYERRGTVYTFAVFTKKSNAVATALKGTFEF